MTKAQARQQIRAHENSAERARTRKDFKKAAQHEAAIAHYRKTFKFPKPVSFGRDHPNIVTVRNAEDDRINQWKNSR